MFNKLKQFCIDNNFILGDTLIYGRYGTDDISVTELLSIIIDPGFEYVKNNHAEKLKQACDRGIEIHSILEDKKIKSNKDYVLKYKRVHRQWELIYNIETISREQTFYKDGIRGTIDLITSNGIVDYKTSRHKNIKYWLQIAAYCRLSNNTKGFILYMDQKGYDFIEIENIEYHIEIFKELIEYSKTINNYKQHG